MNVSDLRKILEKGTVLENEPMNRHTTFRAGGPADFFCIPYDTEELSALVRFLQEENAPYFILGNGSNLLVSDRGYRGCVIFLGKQNDSPFSAISVEEREDEAVITAGAGALMSAVGHTALTASLKGFEPLSGIPGCVGGACIMNAGAYGGELKDVICKAKCVLPDGTVKEFAKEEMSFRYRGSSLSDAGCIVTEASFLLKKGDPSEIKGMMDELTRRRREKQPLEYPSAGSTFKRPEGYFAGKLIEDAGLKGARVGGASVSEKHAGFVINDQNGTAEDISRLIQKIQDTVYEKYGVHLETEVKLLGEF